MSSKEGKTTQCRRISIGERKDAWVVRRSPRTEEWIRSCEIGKSEMILYHHNYTKGMCVTT